MFGEVGQFLLNNPADLDVCRFPLQSFCPRGRSEHVSTFAIGV